MLLQCNPLPLHSATSQIAQYGAASSQSRPLDVFTATSPPSRPSDSFRHSLTIASISDFRWDAHVHEFQACWLLISPAA